MQFQFSVVESGPGSIAPVKLDPGVYLTTLVVTMVAVTAPADSSVTQIDVSSQIGGTQFDVPAHSGALSQTKLATFATLCVVTAADFLFDINRNGFAGTIDVYVNACVEKIG